MNDDSHSENSESHDNTSAWLDALCDRFEDAWGTGKQFSIEFVLAEISADKRDAALKALLQVEVELRSADGNAATAEELRRRFPDDQAIVETVLQNPLPDDSMLPDETIAPRGTDDDDDVPNSDPLRIPRQLGRYRIIRKLGQGAMGSVFLAHDEQLDRQVALKIPRGDLQRNREMRLRFEREAQAAAALHHPNICPIHDIGEYEGVHYICMGYIEGFSLTRYAIAESGLSEQRIAELVLKMAKALAVAHEAGFIHRDLKPANVMVNLEDDPVILDFGLARRIDRSEDLKVTQTGTTLGSPAYMSPEQVDGDQDKVGPHSDVYSLGVILYELLTGRIPFEGSLASVMGQIMTKEPDKPSEYRKDLSVRLENTCQRMMAKDPTKRHPSMHAVVAGLQEYLEKFDAQPQPAAVSSEESQVDQGQKRRDQITKLIASGDYGQAEKMLVALSRESDESYVDAATWAAAELPKLRKTREEVRAGRQEMYVTASRFMKSHDYEQAVQLLEEYPYDLRTPKMQQLLEDAEAMANEVKLLRKEIRATRSRGDNAALLPLLNALLEIKPGDRRAKELREQLTKKAVRPLSRAFGKQTPKFIDRMPANIQWVTLFAVTIVLLSFLAYQWSSRFLPSDGPRPVPTPAPTPEPTPVPTPEPTGANSVLDFSTDPLSRVEIPTLRYNPAKPLTMEAWVNLKDGRAQGIISAFTFLPGAKSLGTYLGATNGKWDLEVGNGQQRVDGLKPGNVPVIFDRWTHVASVISERRVKLFVDGKLADERFISIGLATPVDNFYLGVVAQRDGVEDLTPRFNFGFTGLLDEVRISESIRYTSNFTPQRHFEPDSETTALYHCDAGSGLFLTDDSGNGHRGRMILVGWRANDTLSAVVSGATAAAAANTWTTLFDGTSLNGWSRVGLGKARFSVEGGAIVGTTVEGSPNTFLATNKEYSDFELEFETRIDSSLNSGVQIRSREKTADDVAAERKRTGKAPKANSGVGRFFGPQVEIEPSPGQSGYIYGEGMGAGWLSPSQIDKPDLTYNHFRNGEWNRVRVIASGPRIQTWINGMKVEDMTDKNTYGRHNTGKIALQVHGVKSGLGPFRSYWRNIRIRPLQRTGGGVLPSSGSAWVDLLQRTTASGNNVRWTKSSDGKLYFVGNPSRGDHVVVLNGELANNYEVDLDMEVTDVVTQLALTIPVNNGLVVFALANDARVPDVLGGLEHIDAVSFKENVLQVKQRLIPDRSLKLRVLVRSSIVQTEIEVHANGASVYRWQGATNRLSLISHWNHGQGFQLGIGALVKSGSAGQTAVVVSKVNVRQLSPSSTP